MTKTIRSLVLVAAGLLCPIAEAQERLAFVPLPEACRLLDTRVVAAPAGGALEPGVIRGVQADGGPCGVPIEAKAIQTNVTATNTKGAGFLSVMRPTGHIPANPEALTSILNFSGPGQTVANAAFIQLGSRLGHNWDGTFWIFSAVSGTDVVIDVSGYYVLAP